MRKLTVSVVMILFVAVLGVSCSSQNSVIDLEYGIYSAPNPLLQLEAKSVVRASEVTLEVFDTQKAVYTIREAITILDKEHADLSTLVVPYDQLSTINAMQANLYDKNGSLVRSYYMKDADDYSDYDGFSFFTDNRVKVFEIFSSTYPYTVEYEYVITHKSTLNLPSWFPQTSEQSVEKANFTLIDHQTGVRFHQKNYETEPEVAQILGAKKYTWTSEFIMPQKRDPFGPHYREILPHVLVAPGSFKMDEYNGNAESWEAFGSWYYEMGKGTRMLPNAAKAEIESLVSGLSDEEDIVRVLYQHVQQKNRYVSIQLGIGGWKPFPAEFVYENS